MLPLAVLVGSLLVTAAAGMQVAASAKARDRLQFNLAVQETQGTITGRLDTHQGILRSGAGLFIAAGAVSHAGFRAYVERLEMTRHYPGVLGIGASVLVRPGSEAGILRMMRQRDFAEFRFWPEDSAGERHAIIYLEPLNSRNRRALGYNMFSEPTRRAAMARARDSGQPAASGRVTLVQEIDDDKQPGFLIYMPVYGGQGTPATAAARRQRLLGFVYSPFRAHDLFRGIFRGGPGPRVDFDIYDGTQPGAEHLLFSSPRTGRAATTTYRPQFQSVQTIDVAGRPWTIRYQSRPESETSVAGVLPVTVGAGLLISLLLFLTSWVQVGKREAAEQSAAALRVSEAALREQREALEESEARFRVMADGAPVLIWMSDEEDRGTWFNQPWLAFTGRTPEQERGCGWAESVHPDDLERAVAFRERAFRAREPFTMEFRLRRRDGAWRWLLDTGVPLYGPEGEFTGYIGSCIDITEQKDAEETLRDANRQKDEFLAMLSHELRNPLSPLVTAAGVIQRVGSDSPLIQRQQEVIGRQVTKMARLLDDLLDVSRITSGKVSLHPERLDLREVVHQAVEACRAGLDQRRHEVRIALPERPVFVNADAVRLEQVLSNLIHNAAKYTEPGGRIEVSLLERGGQALLTVRDNGMGIAPELLPRMFDLFTQGERTIDRAAGGLGIGLTMVRTLIELHGGSVSVRSAGPGQGSEFTVRLPTKEPAGVDATL